MTFQKAKIMGILNVTPDSFYEKSRYFNPEFAIQQGIQMYKDGADIIDIGGESSRPYALPVSIEEELNRVIPIIIALKKEIPIPLSIDTTKAQVARVAVANGATLINDISGFKDPEMINVAREANTPICAMHMQGDPQTMQLNPIYENGVVNHLIDWFKEKITTLIGAGIRKENIILDPGIGFGKTVDDNLEIIHNLQRFKAMGFPILLGLSRKSFMSKIVDKTAENLLPETIAMSTVALLGGVHIIRVHDVKDHRGVVDLMDKFNNYKKPKDNKSKNEGVSTTSSGT